MAHGSKMITRVLTEADQAIGMARHFAPQIAAAWSSLPPSSSGNALPDTGAYLESIAARIFELRERLSSAHLERSHLRARLLFQHANVREAAARLRDLLVDVRFLLDRTCGKGQGHANFEGRSDLQRIPIGSLERISVHLLTLLRDNRFGWGEKPFGIDLRALCLALSRRIAELQDANEVLRTLRSQERLAYNERFRSGAADERELRQRIGVLRSLLTSSGHALEAKELRRIRPRPRRQSSQRAATQEVSTTPAKARQLTVPIPPGTKAKRWKHRQRRQARAARAPRLAGSS